MSKILIPVPKKSKAKIFPLAPRPSRLKGKTIALYHNDKVASFPAMETIGELLKKKIGVKETFEVHSEASFSRHPDRAIEEALRADAVVAGTGD